MLSKIGSDKVVLDNRKKSLRFLKNGMEIDLGGIAKGYAVDKAALVLRKSGIKNALIDAGGDIYCIGEKAKGQKWIVGVRDPIEEHRVIEELALQDLAAATSGGYENFLETEGKQYNHIIDPRDGNPVENNLISVTIIAKDCLTADALATAVSVLGREKGTELINSLDTVGAILISKVNGALEIDRL